LAFFFGAFTAKADTSDDELEEAEPSLLGCDGGSATESPSKTGCSIVFELGLREGLWLGDAGGDFEGPEEGDFVGDPVGPVDGEELGLREGLWLGV
jgi:hypothetical protein